VLAVAAEIAAGMSYLHARGIVHGDLTGANILLTSNAVRPARLEPWAAVASACERAGRDTRE
jgi:serine/threonine protein kinase